MNERQALGDRDSRCGDVAFGEGIGGARLGEEVTAERRAGRLLVYQTGVRVVRHERRVEPAHTLAG